MTSPIVVRWHPGLLEESISIEKKLWMPGYAATAEVFLGRHSVFPQGQLAALVNGRLVGWVSIQRTAWDGQSYMLQTWDAYAGGKADFSDSVVSQGNALVLMSMCSIARGVVTSLIAAADALAHELGLEHLIVMARPDGFGEYFYQQFRMKGYLEYCSCFEEYVVSGIDRWQSILMAKGFSKFHQISWYSAEIGYDADAFTQLRKSWYPDLWWEFGGRHYCRRELGVFQGTTYSEPNVVLEKPL